MSVPLEKIIFVHEGKAAYPEIGAYRAYFSGRYATEEATPAQLCRAGPLGNAVCWHMMGFYRTRPKAGFVIHDYRSLSVGKLRGLKDLLKKILNARPDLRIFQNEEMRRAMDFSDSVPSLLLPMGVPPDALDFRARTGVEPSCDFCYIGVMSAERRTHLMIDSFLKRFGTAKSFYLYGTPEPQVRARYEGNKNVVFAGRLDQKSLFAEIARARVAVNYFPDHFPHRLQTPTKMLEYAALGLKILSNEQPQSRAVAQRYALRSLWGETGDMFKNVPDSLEWPDNAHLDPSPFLWPSVIAQSRVAEAIERAER